MFMLVRSVLLISVSFGIIAQIVENVPQMASVDLSERHMLRLESELQPNSAESTYVRVIVWREMPTSEDLQNHFDKFDLLKVQKQEFKYGKFDISENNESTYERFIYLYSIEQEITITIFIKAKFNNKKNPSVMKYFITKTNCALKNYGIIDNDNIVCGEAHSDINSSTTLYYILFGCIIVLIVVVMILHYRLASVYNIFGNILHKINVYSKAASCFKKELAIREKQLGENHSDLVNLYNKIGFLYFKCRDHSKALWFYRKELKIREELYSQNYHQHLTNLKDDIDSVYFKIKEYHESISFDNNKPINLKGLHSQNYFDLPSLYMDICFTRFAISNDQNKIRILVADVKPVQELFPPNSTILQDYKQKLQNLVNKETPKN